MQTLDMIMTRLGEVDVGRAELGDLLAVVGIQNDAWGWLVSQGITGQWGVGSFPTDPDDPDLEFWRQVIASGEQYLAARNGSAIGTLAVSFTAPDHPWGQRACERQGSARGREGAGYVSLLATRRAVSGQGIGVALLDWAARWVAQHGKEYLRLTCWAENEKLCSYYEQAGFQALGDYGEKWRGRMFERRVTTEGEADHGC